MPYLGREANVGIEYLTRGDGEGPGVRDIGGATSITSPEVRDSIAGLLASYPLLQHPPKDGAGGVWTLRYIDAAERWALLRRRHSEQAQRQGDIQIVFAPKDVTAERAWSVVMANRDREWLEVDSLLRDIDWDLRMSSFDPDLIGPATACLEALVREDRCASTGIGAEPTLDVISLLLAALPEGLARTVQWSDVHLENGLSRPCVTGLFPVDWPPLWALYPEESIERVSISQTDNYDKLHWLVSQTQLGATPLRSGLVTSFSVLINEVVEQMPYTDEDIQGILSGRPTEQQLNKIRADEGAIGRFIDAQEISPANLLLKHFYSLAFWDLFSELASRSDCDWRLPLLPDVGDPAWGKLAVLFKSKRVSADGLFMINRFREPGGPLSSETQLRGARDWLKSLGITREEHPELFPADVESLVFDYENTGSSDDLARFVSDSSDRYGAMVQVLSELNAPCQDPTLLSRLTILVLEVSGQTRLPFEMKELLRLRPLDDLEAERWVANWAIEVSKGKSISGEQRELLTRTLISEWCEVYPQQGHLLRRAVLALLLEPYLYSQIDTPVFRSPSAASSIQPPVVNRTRTGDRWDTEDDDGASEHDDRIFRLIVLLVMLFIYGEIIIRVWEIFQ